MQSDRRFRLFDPLTIFAVISAFVLGAVGVYGWPALKAIIAHNRAVGDSPAETASFGILSGNYVYYNSKRPELDRKATLEFKTDHSFSYSGKPALFQTISGVDGSYIYNPVTTELKLTNSKRSMSVRGQVSGNRITFEGDADGVYLFEDTSSKKSGYDTVVSNNPGSGPLPPPGNILELSSADAPRAAMNSAPVSEMMVSNGINPVYEAEAEHSLAAFLNDYCRQRAAILGRGVEITRVTWLPKKVGAMVEFDEGQYRKGTAQYSSGSGWRWLLRPDSKRLD